MTVCPNQADTRSAAFTTPSLARRAAKARGTSTSASSCKTSSSGALIPKCTAEKDEFLVWPSADLGESTFGDKQHGARARAPSGYEVLAPRPRAVAVSATHEYPLTKAVANLDRARAKIPVLPLPVGCSGRTVTRMGATLCRRPRGFGFVEFRCGPGQSFSGTGSQTTFTAYVRGS